MNFIKDYLVTFILIILIIAGMAGIGLFCYNSLFVEEPKISNETNALNSLNNTTNTLPSNKNNSDNINTNTTQNEIINNETNDENIENPNQIEELPEGVKTIDMSRYYLDTKLGDAAIIYNNMLKVFEQQKSIAMKAAQSYTERVVLDLERPLAYFKYPTKDEYVSQTNTINNTYTYFYDTNSSTWQSIPTTDFFDKPSFVHDLTTIGINNDTYTWDYKYNKNIIKNDLQCYEVIATWTKSDYNQLVGFVQSNGYRKFYIDMNTYNLIEIEGTIGIKDWLKTTQFNIQVEYTNEKIELPIGAKEFFENY